MRNLRNPALMLHELLVCGDIPDRAIDWAQVNAQTIEAAKLCDELVDPPAIQPPPGSITVSRQAFTLGQTDVPGEPSLTPPDRPPSSKGASNA